MPTPQIAATARAQRSETAAKQVAAELVSARGRLSKLEASLAARGAESVRLQKLLVAAEAAASAQVRLTLLAAPAGRRACWTDTQRRNIVVQSR